MKCTHCGSIYTRRVMAHPMDAVDQKVQFFCDNCVRYFYQKPRRVE